MIRGLRSEGVDLLDDLGAWLTEVADRVSADEPVLDGDLKDPRESHHELPDGSAIDFALA